MPAVALVWAEFALCAAAIGVAGSMLSRYGDAIAAHTGLSRSWIGLILLATVTSLPELVTGLSAVTVGDAPDIAAGDVLGSCVLNLAILAVIDVLDRRNAVYALANVNHAISAGLGVVLLSTVAAAIVLTQHGALPRLGHVSVASLAIVGIYLAGMRVLYVAEQHRTPAPRAAPAIDLKRALTGYALAAAAIVGMGIWLPFIGLELAAAMGWSNSFVGTLFVALATSLPELATTWGAMRIGAIDLAFGNLLGSNLFDVLILALDDLAYLSAPLFDKVSPVHGVSALFACAMSGTVVVALLHRPVRRLWRVGTWASFALIALYGIHAVVQVQHAR